MKDPLKRGLKLIVNIIYNILLNSVEVKDPLKQGLKHLIFQPCPSFTEGNVEVKDPLKQGLKQIRHKVNKACYTKLK